MIFNQSWLTDNKAGTFYEKENKPMFYICIIGNS